MGTFDTSTPARLQLAAWEQRDRRAAINPTVSAAPADYAPIAAPDPVYSHVGHAAQYGRGRRNGRTVRLLVLHVTDVDGSFLGAMSYDARRADIVSTQAFAGPNGELGAEVPDQDRAFTTGRWNDESDALEVIGHDEWTAAKWRSRPRQMEAITRWLVERCRRRNIPPVWLDRTAVADGASRHGTTPVQGVRRGVTDHLEANQAARLLGATSGTGHVCVGPGLREVVFADILPEARRRLAGVTPPPRPQPQWRPPVTTLHMLDTELRIVDTREGLGLTRPPLESTVDIVIPNAPDGTAPTAAVLHLTVTGANAPGFVAMFGDNPANTSRLNYAPADTSPPANTTLVAVGRRPGDGAPVVRAIMRGAGTAELIVDLIAVLS